MLGAEGIKPGLLPSSVFWAAPGEIKLPSLLVTANQPMIPPAYPLNILNGARIHSWNLSGFWCVMGGGGVVFLPQDQVGIGGRGLVEEQGR